MVVLAGIASVTWSVAPARVSGGAQDADSAGVGVVAGYYSTGEPPSITRVSERRQQLLKVGSIVMAGDQVSLPTGASVTVFLSNGGRLQWLGPGTFVVPTARRLGPLAAIFASLPRLFDDEYKISGTAATRSFGDCTADGQSGPAIELLVIDGTTRLEAGVRDVQMYWQGGCPPFSAQLTAASGTVASLDSLSDREARFEHVALPPGRYGVRVTDASGRTAVGTFEAAREPPPMPAAVTADTTELGVIAGALWLAQFDGGRWRLESLQRLRPLAEAGNPLATDLERQLLHPPPPP